MKVLLTATATIAFLLSGCGSDLPVVVVHNRSGRALTDVEVFGSGFEHHIGNLPDSGHKTIAVKPKSDTGVGIRFKAAGKYHELPASGYFGSHPAYQLSLIVNAELETDVQTQLEFSCLSWFGW